MRSLRSCWYALRDQMVSDPLSPNRVATGWALGMFIGCTIPFGLQLMVSIPLAFLLRVSKVGATIGTFITNPVTIFVIYPVQTWVGCRLLGLPLSWNYVREVSAKLGSVSMFSANGWETLSEIGGRVLAGFFFGGFLLAAVCTPIAYFAVRRIVLKHRAHIGR